MICRSYQHLSFRCTQCSWYFSSVEDLVIRICEQQKASNVKMSDECEKNGSKRSAEEEIEIAALGDEKVYVDISLSKKLLAKNSPLLRRQYCELEKELKSGVKFNHLDVGNISLEAFAVFACNIESENVTRRIPVSNHDQLVDVYLLAHKYGLNQLKQRIEKFCDDGWYLSCEDVFYWVFNVLKYNHLLPLAEINKKIIKKCVKVIHYNQVDVLDLWASYGEQDADALIFLSAEVEKFREENKGPLCPNCRAYPCLDGFEIRDVWSGMRVSKRVNDELVIRKVSLTPEEIKPTSEEFGWYPDCGNDDDEEPETVTLKGKMFFYEQSLSKPIQDECEPESETFIYRCKV